MNETVKIKGRISTIIYPKEAMDVNQGDFAVLKVEALEVKQGELDKSFEGFPCYVISVAGEVPTSVSCGGIYEFELKFGKSKYGMQYSIVDTQLDSISNSDEVFWMYIESIFTETQVDSMLKAGVNVRSAFETGNAKALCKIKGVGEATAEKWLEKYHKDLSLKDGIAKLKPFDFTHTAKVKLARAYKEPGQMNKFIRDIKQNPYHIMDRVDGWGWERTDKYARSMGFAENAPQRIQAFIKYWFNKQANESGHSWMTNAQLVSAIREYFPNLTNEEIKDAVQGMIPDIEGENYSNKDAQLYIDRSTRPQRLGTLVLRETEEAISANFFRLMRAPNFELRYLEESIKETERKFGLEFTEEQKQAMRGISQNKVTVLTAPSGTGKTTTMIPIVEAIKKQGLDFKMGALSGKASLNLAEITDSLEHTSTIHNMLSFVPDDNSEASGDTKNVSSAFAEDKMLKTDIKHMAQSDQERIDYENGFRISADVVIIDEVSMIGGYLFKDLVANIPDRAKLILIGDEGQLEAIGYANILHDVKASMAIPVFTLTQILRQAAKSGIISDSFKIYKKQQFIPADLVDEVVHGELQDFKIVPREEQWEMRDVVCREFEKFLLQGVPVKDIAVVTPKRSKGMLSAVEMNREIQKIVQKNYKGPVLDVTYKEGLTVYHVEYKIGDRVMATRNNYSAELSFAYGQYGRTEIYNGNIGTILDIRKDEWGAGAKKAIINTLVIEFPQGIIEMRYDPASKKPFDLQLGYAATCHKLQGMSIPYVIVAVDPSAYTLISNEYLYTAITRAKKYCVLTGRTGFIRMAVRKSSVAQKQTWLCEILQRDRDEYQKSLGEKEESPFKRLTF